MTYAFTRSALAALALALPAPALAAAAGDAAAPPPDAALAASALLAIDRNRATIVERIVADWGDALAADAGLSKEQLREMLRAMRADALLAASLAGSPDGLKSIVVASSDAAPGTRSKIASVQPAALGDAGQDLVYTPIAPCRLFDTRVSQGGQGTPVPGVRRTYGAIVPVPQQGGPGGCTAGADAAAVLVQIGTIAPAAIGLLQVGPYPSGPLTNAVVQYQPGDQYGATVTVPVSPSTGGKFDLVEQFGAADLYGDLLGFFRPASGFVAAVSGGAGIAVGGTATVPAVSVADGFRLPQGCQNGQVAKGDGSGGWVCAADLGSGGGGVSSLLQGSGILLSPSPITSVGSINVNTQAIQARVTGSCAAGSSIRAIEIDGSVVCQPDTSGQPNAFVQGGNAFGAVAALGTTDPFALELRASGARAMRYEPHAISPNVVGGSGANVATSGVHGATIAGGAAPSASDIAYPVAPNRVTDDYGAVGGGAANRAGNDALPVSDAAFATVAGGLGNTAGAASSVVGGGSGNVAAAPASVVAGGSGNAAAGDRSAVLGGEANVASGARSVVAGGSGNAASGAWSAVGGGAQNVAAGSHAWAGGYRAKAQSADSTPIAHAGAFVWSDTVDADFHSSAANEFAVRATGGVRFVTAVDGTGAPSRSVAFGPTGSIAIGGAAEPGSMLTIADAANPTIVLRSRTAGATESGRIRFAEQSGSGDCAGGYLRYDGASNLFEVGVQPAGFACSSAADVASVRISRSTGRIGLLAPPSSNPVTVGSDTTNGNGAHVSPGGVWTNGSSRTFKVAFEPVDAGDVLRRVVALPIARWSYRGHESERHLGPVAEDFEAAFGLGGDARYIGTVDADGVALAAIQGLNAKLEATVAAQAREIAQLRRMVEALLARPSAR